MNEASSSSRVIKAASVVGSATMVSRITGFVRDIFIAALLGAGPLAEIFVIAFRLPNLFRRLFAEGAFNAAFVPLFSERLEAEGLRGTGICRSDIVGSAGVFDCLHPIGHGVYAGIGAGDCPRFCG